MAIPCIVLHRRDAARADHSLGDEGDVMSNDNPADAAQEPFCETERAGSGCVPDGPPVAGMAYVTRRVIKLLQDLNRASSAGVAPSSKLERQRYIVVLVHLSKFIRDIGG